MTLHVDDVAHSAAMRDKLPQFCNGVGDAAIFNGRRRGRHMKHRLFAMIRERFGCRHTDLPYGRYKEAASRLIEEPLE